MRQVSRSTRDRILEAAVRSFETSGLRGATVNAIAEKAGVTKRTFYYHFRSKDNLIAATLEETQNDIVNIGTSDLDTLDGLVRELFDAVELQASDVRWKGCAFSRAVAELAGLPGHPAVSLAKAYKDGIEMNVCRLSRRAGIKEPAAFARRLMILLEGAIAQSLVHHDSRYAKEARMMALELINAGSQDNFDRSEENCGKERAGVGTTTGGSSALLSS